MIGETVGNYRVLEQLGRGGMGAVYLAQHLLIGRKAAIKVLLPEASQRETVVKRFFDEARATSAIRHPGIVEIYDFGYHTNGQAFIVMEYLDGQTLSRRLRRKDAVSLAKALDIIGQVTGAIGAAHNKQIVHRDLKPDNLFLTPDVADPSIERVKVLDFGVAKLSDLGDGPWGTTKTGSGVIVGTPMYMSPEQCRGTGDVDSRADLYSLGCIMYRMLTGAPPFRGRGGGDLIAQHIYREPVRPTALVDGMPLEVEAVILRLLAKDPADRYQSATELLGALEALTALVGQTKLRPTMRFWRVDLKTAEDARDDVTTLGGASAEVGDRMTVLGGLPRWVPAAILGTAVAVGGVVGFALHQRSKSGEQLESAAAFARTADAEPAATQPELPPEPAPAPAPEPAPAAVEQVEILVDSDPGGADVFRKADGAKVGETPYVHRAPARSGELMFIVKMDGYHSEEVSMPADVSSEGDPIELVKIADDSDRKHRAKRHDRAKEPGHKTPGAKDPGRDKTKTRKTGKFDPDAPADPFAGK